MQFVLPKNYHDCVPPVRLHTVPGLFGTRLWATTVHCTPNCASCCQYSTKPVGPAFIAGAQLLNRTRLPDQLADRVFAVADRAQAAYLTIRFDYRCSNRLGMDIQTKNRNFSLMTGSSLVALVCS